MKRWIIVGIGVCLALLGTGMVYEERLLVATGNYLITEGTLERADAIFVLSGGIPERMLEAVDLYRAGYAPRIVLSKGPAPPYQDVLKALGVIAPEPHEVNVQIAAKLGISDGTIVLLDPRVNSTYRELALFRDYSYAQGLHSVILVSSKHHMTRVYKIFQHLTVGKIAAIPRPSHYDVLDPKQWWKNRLMAKRVLYEYPKLANFYLRERWQ